MINFTVPLGEGHLIGDLLRKYLTRCTLSWQMIGFTASSSSVNFSFDDVSESSFMKLLTGRIVSRSTGGLLLSPTAERGTVKSVNLYWDGQTYSDGDIVLDGVDHEFGDVLKIYILYAQGYNTAEANYELVKKANGGDTYSVVAIPSAHSIVRKVKYTVEPMDDVTETLSMEVDNSLLVPALKQLLETLGAVQRGVAG